MNATIQEHLVGESVKIKDIHDRILHLRLYDREMSTNVLLLGETGTGKTYAARMIHPDRRFYRIALPEINQSTALSELCGHTKGSFSGAFENRQGQLRQASGGVLFLDEIGDIPTDMQAMLLTFAEERKFRAIGSQRTEAIQCGLIAATNRDLNREITEGQFRKDLYYRLAGEVLEFPPLRNRREDILPIARHHAEHLGIDLTREFERALMHDGLFWPGNVRQLIQVIRRYGTNAQYGLSQLRAQIEDRAEGVLTHGRDLRLESAKRAAVADALILCRWNKTQAARALDISRPTLDRMMLRYRLAERGE